MKVPFIFYADLELFLVKMSIYLNNPKKLSTTKINKHTVLVIHYLQIVHLIKQKFNSIIIETKII